MKRLVICVALLIVAGCGSPGANIGLGTSIGAALSHTISGAKADLEKREQKLIAAYNQGIEIGMEQEDLDQIKQQIRDTQLTRQTVETGEQLLGVDWNDPKQTGGAIGLVSSLVFLWLNRKKRIKTEKELAGQQIAINKFCGTSDPRIAGILHDTVQEKVAEQLAG